MQFGYFFLLDCLRENKHLCWTFPLTIHLKQSTENIFNWLQRVKQACAFKINDHNRNCITIVFQIDILSPNTIIVMLYHLFISTVKTNLMLTHGMFNYERFLTTLQEHKHPEISPLLGSFSDILRYPIIFIQDG